MAFEFINTTTIDSETRKRIRSHVMKGRNVGKIRPQKAKVTIAKRTILQNTSLKSSNDQGLSCSLQASPSNPEDEITVTSSPITTVAFSQVKRNAKFPPSPMTRPVEIPRSLGHEMAMWPMPIQLTTVTLRNIHSCKESCLVDILSNPIQT